MDLVERFIEIDSGPTNRKVLLASGTGVPTVIAIWPFGHLGAARSDVIDMSRHDLMYLVAAVVLAVAALLGRPLVTKQTGPAGTIVRRVLVEHV